MINELLGALQNKIFDGAWYGESFAGFLFAALIGGTIVGFFGYLKSLRYRGWKACIVEHAKTDNMPEERESLKLLPEEVRQVLGSDLDGFRNIRSMVSGYCQITTPNLDSARNSGWLKVNRHTFPLSLLGRGTIIVSLPDLPASELRDGKWNAGCEPRGWRDAPGIRNESQVLFVSGHDGAHEWARRRGIIASNITHLTTDHIERLKAGDTVIGTLPVNLIHEVQKRGGRYVHLSLDLPPEARVKARSPEGLSADDMDAFGATLQHFSLSYLGDWSGN